MRGRAHSAVAGAGCTPVVWGGLAGTAQGVSVIRYYVLADNAGSGPFTRFLFHKISVFRSSGEIGPEAASPAGAALELSVRLSLALSGRSPRSGV